ncbi:hypothetical protein DFQ28_009639 [Apophysomyces sp. BC1034]|nr:hypothetical protein DFQ30_009386 [Apophysomyces sp. BC1015]KAG0172476.1 hypothetical protein DFQ29_008345 [Apophysomyces sp. BC1021]KAG0185250.1 hypothetical protein DFQ28_009639 [Apophysomyces sp. BC1034]
MVQNKQVLFTKVPTTFPVAGEHLQVKESSIDLEASLPKGDILVKNLVLSVDPYLRGRMRDASVKSFIPAFELNKPISAGVVSVVLKSNNPKFKAGDLVTSDLGVHEEYSRYNAEFAEEAFEIRKDIKETNLPLTHYVGVLGMPGQTAYVGLLKFGEPKAGETLYVSAAAGAVGQLVGQIGKVLGLHVVGSAGSDEKVAYLKEIGFDGAFNYKTESVDAKLSELCPDGIDIYFENVGGQMLEHVLNHANDFGRIIACGMISQYNREKPEGVYNLMNIVTKRLKIQGFVVLDYPEMKEDFTKQVTEWLQQGKVKYRETVAEGIEQTPQALIDVLKGKNFGKQVVKVADL